MDLVIDGPKKRPKPQAEGEIKANILTYLDLLQDIVVFPIDTRAAFSQTLGRWIKKKQNGRNVYYRGVPDILCFDRLGAFAIEVKTKTGKISDEQEQCILALAKIGISTLLARNLTVVREFIQNRIV